MDSFFVFEGYVTATNEFGYAGPAYVQDANAGMAVYNADNFDWAGIELGVHVRVYGWMGFYNGLTFHRVIPDFMVQAGPDTPGELTRIQNRLFDLGAELAVPGAERIGAEDVAWLEAALDRYNADLPPLREFVLPGGDPAATWCHLARAVCRRSERHLVSLAREEGLNPQTLRYINRLSDLLFVLARVLARRDGGSEVLWRPGATA
jgi:cob(I)alamin adenosyltransferase